MTVLFHGWPALVCRAPEPICQFVLIATTVPMTCVVTSAIDRLRKMWKGSNLRGATFKQILLSQIFELSQTMPVGYFLLQVFLKVPQSKMTVRVVINGIGLWQGYTLAVAPQRCPRRSSVAVSLSLENTDLLNEKLTPFGRKVCFLMSLDILDLYNSLNSRLSLLR